MMCECLQARSSGDGHANPDQGTASSACRAGNTRKVARPFPKEAVRTHSCRDTRDSVIFNTMTAMIKNKNV